MRRDDGVKMVSKQKKISELARVTATRNQCRSEAHGWLEYGNLAKGCCPNITKPIKSTIATTTTNVGVHHIGNKPMLNADHEGMQCPKKMAAKFEKTRAQNARRVKNTMGWNWNHKWNESTQIADTGRASCGKTGSWLSFCRERQPRIQKNRRDDEN